MNKKSPLRLTLTDTPGLFSGVVRTAERLAESAFGLNALDKLYREIPGYPGKIFFEQLLNALHVDLDINEDELNNIPREGKCLVVANHPFGGIEGIAMYVLLHRVRPDVKILANDLLHRIPEVRDHFIPVNPFGAESSVRANLAGLRQSIDWLAGEGMLGVFPSGEVSHWQGFAQGVTDPQWLASTAGIVRKADTTVVPMFFNGQNGWFFQFAGLIHPGLRTALLIREFLKKKNHRLNIKIGRPISSCTLQNLNDDRQVMSYLRSKTYSLNH